MRRFLSPAAGLLCAIALLTSCAGNQPDESVQESRPGWSSVLARQLGMPPGSLFEVPLPDTLVCSQETNLYYPVESIAVTVRGGRLARGNGLIRVPARDGSDSLSTFMDTLQRQHRSPALEVSPNGQWVVLKVSGHPGQSDASENNRSRFEQTIALLRCTQDEGNLVRIHVDAPERGAQDPGPSSITVTGIYDSLTSDEALIRREYSCIRCGRVEVCGVPACQ